MFKIQNKNMKCKIRIRSKDRTKMMFIELNIFSKCMQLIISELVILYKYYYVYVEKYHMKMS